MINEITNETAAEYVIRNGTDGNDIIDGRDIRAQIDGGKGRDIIFTGSYDDRIDGGDGSDWINTDAGDDYIDGGSGNDLIMPGKGNDTVVGGDGVDLVEFSGSSSDYNIEVVEENGITYTLVRSNDGQEVNRLSEVEFVFFREDDQTYHLDDTYDYIGDPVPSAQSENADSSLQNVDEVYVDAEVSLDQASSANDLTLTQHTGELFI